MSLRKVLMHRTRSISMASFSVILKEDLDDGGFTAIVPELPGCISDGDTKAQALRHIKEAISLYLESISDEKRRYEALAKKGQPVEFRSISVQLPV